MTREQVLAWVAERLAAHQKSERDSRLAAVYDRQQNGSLGYAEAREQFANKEAVNVQICEAIIAGLHSLATVEAERDRLTAEVERLKEALNIVAKFTQLAQADRDKAEAERDRLRVEVATLTSDLAICDKLYRDAAETESVLYGWKERPPGPPKLLAREVLDRMKKAEAEVTRLTKRWEALAGWSALPEVVNDKMDELEAQ